MECHSKFIQAEAKARNRRLADNYRDVPALPKPDCDVIPINEDAILTQFENGAVAYERPETVVGLERQMEVVVLRQQRLAEELYKLLKDFKLSP